MTRVKVKPPQRREASIEAAACAVIGQELPDVIIRKLNGAGDRNWPDRMLLYKGGCVLFLEFKRPGERPTPGQAWFFDQLEGLGFRVRVVDSVAAARYEAHRARELFA